MVRWMLSSVLALSLMLGGLVSAAPAAVGVSAAPALHRVEGGKKHGKKHGKNKKKGKKKGKKHAKKGSKNGSARKGHKKAGKAA
jgi:hypothetical protein